MTRVLRWRIAFLVLSVVGACLSADLMRLHIRVHTDPNYHSYCAMSERVNCETVAASSYSVILDLPLALWGLLAYVLMFILTVLGLRRQLPSSSWPFGLLASLSLVSVTVSILLFAVSHFAIQSVCIVCAGTYLVNFAMAGVAIAEIRRCGVGILSAFAGDVRVARRDLLSHSAAVLAAGIAVVGLWAGVPRYWKVTTSSGPEGLAVGHTGDGHPWIGAASPSVNIVEFSDYQCPHCRRGHEEIRKLIRKHPDKIRLTHRQYPLDHHCNSLVKRSFHPHACLYARFSICSDQQGHFWQANDLLFARGRQREPITARNLAAELGLDAEEFTECVDRDKTAATILLDLEAGRSLNIRGTPTFVLDGEVFPGRIPPEIIQPKLGMGDAGNGDRSESGGFALHFHNER